MKLPDNPQAKPAAHARVMASRLGGISLALVVSQLAVGLTYVLAARSISPSVFGLLSSGIAVAFVAASIFDFGLTNFLVREIASGRQTGVHALGLLKTKQLLSPILLVAVSVPAIIITSDVMLGVLIGVAGSALWASQASNGIMRATNRFRSAAVSQVAGRLLGLACMFTLTSHLTAPGLLVASISIGYLLELTANRIVRKHRSVRMQPLRALGACQKKAISFGLVSLSSTGQQADVPLVSAGGGFANGGVYASASRLLGPLLFLSTTLSLVGSPWLAEARRRGDIAREERRVRNWSYVLALVPVVVSFLAPFLVSIILGEQYSQAAPVLSILCLGAAISTVNQGQAVILQNRMKEKLVGRSIAVGLIVSLLATFVLAILGDSAVASLGFVLGQAIIWITLSWGGRR